MDEDPIGMLFGTRCAKWLDGAEAKISHAMSSDTLAGSTSPKPERANWDRAHRPPASDPEHSKGKDWSSRHSRSETIVVESLDPEYEIDPITNRRVQKVNPTPRKPARPEVPVTGKSSPVAASSKRTLAQDNRESSDIAVKRFVPPKTSSSTEGPSEDGVASLENAKGVSGSLKPEDPSGWLFQEGFGQRRQSPSEGRSSIGNGDEISRNANSKLESALDRHLQTKSPSQRASVQATPEYAPKENTTEDVDLLHSSDVRASAGLRGKSAKESDSEKKARQRRLEEEYDSRSLRQDTQLADEVAKDIRQRFLGKDTSGAAKSTPELNPSSKAIIGDKGEDVESRSPSKNRADELSEPPVAQEVIKSGKSVVPAVNTKRANQIRSQIVPLKARLDAIKAEYDALRQRWLEEKRKTEEKAAKKVRGMHETEIRAQKAVMEALETRGGDERNLSTASTDQVACDDVPMKSTRRLQSHLPGEGDMASNVHEFAGRDRWYKKKAPHAMDEMDSKLQQLAKDRALVREVRDIYEETYGTIDTSHRQPVASEEVEIPVAADVSSQSPQLLHSPSPAVPASLSKNATGPTSKPELDNNLNPDLLVIIQRLFDALRQAQTLVQEHRNSLQAISDPSTSQILSINENTGALATIQKLFSDLRKAQDVIQGEHSDLKQIPESQALATTLQASGAYHQTVKGIMSSACKLATIGQELSLVLTDLMNSRSKSIGAETKGSQSLNIYRILAFNPAKQKVIASKATSLAPISNEQPLLPVEALEVLKNPGQFLPDLMALHHRGYTIVSGTNNVLVFKKSITKQEAEEAGEEEILNDIDPIDLMGVSRHLSRTSSSSPAYTETEAAREKQEQVDPDSASPTSASSTPPKSSSAETASTESSPADGNISAPAFPTSESNLPPSDKVRREEAVFSGPSRGNWEEAESKRSTRKQRRAMKRSKRIKNMLVTGTVTAACCYAVGVISQMMQH